jgi:hypothetical protein
VHAVAAHVFDETDGQVEKAGARHFARRAIPGIRPFRHFDA